MISMGADETQADFPYVFASAKEGFATVDPDEPSSNMKVLLDMILEHVPGPDVVVVPAVHRRLDRGGVRPRDGLRCPRGAG